MSSSEKLQRLQQDCDIQIVFGMRGEIVTGKLVAAGSETGYNTNLNAMIDELYRKVYGDK